MEAKATEGQREGYVGIAVAAGAVGLSPYLIRRAAKEGKVRSTTTPLGTLVSSSDVAHLKSILTNPTPTNQGWRQRAAKTAPSAVEKHQQLRSAVVATLGDIGPLNTLRLTDILAAKVAVTYPNVKQILRALEQQGQVQATPQGRATIYQLIRRDGQGGEDTAALPPPTLGYSAVGGTGRWIGEVGMGLPIGALFCTPLLPDTSLTIEAVYDDDGQPVYRTSATASGGIVVRQQSATWQQTELLIPAAEGATLGPPAIEVGRLFPPTTEEHSFHKLGRRRAVQPAKANPMRLGSLLASYQRQVE